MMSVALRFYLSAVMAAASLVIVLAPWSRASAYQLAFLCALGVVAERLSRVQISARGASVSVSLVVTLIAVCVLPPPDAALVGMSTGLIPLRRLKLGQALRNLAFFALIPAAGAEVNYLLRGHDAGYFLSFPRFLVPFIAAVTTCIVFNGMLGATFMKLAGLSTFWGVWRSDMLRATMPYYTSAVLALITVVLWNDIGPFTVLLVVVPVYTSHWVFSQYSREQSAYEGTISALVQAVEIKDHYTRGHSERVARGAELIARRMSMSEERIAKIRYAGLLHDIGKLGVPTRLLAKPGKLTDEEYALLCLHPNQGVAVIRDIRFLTDVYDGILYHHERLDGRGYPSGRKGDEIPEFARILGVADAFDAMTSTRSYRAARPVAEAVAELWRGAGTQFDPQLVRAMEEALELEAAAGHPWQVTDEPVQTVEVVDANGVVLGPAFVFEDHDDPMVEQEWYPNRIGAGEHLLREQGRLAAGVAEDVDEAGAGPGRDATPGAGDAPDHDVAAGADDEALGRPAAGTRWFGRGDRVDASGPPAPWEPTVPLSGASNAPAGEPPAPAPPTNIYDAQLDAVSRLLRPRDAARTTPAPVPPAEDAADIAQDTAAAADPAATVEPRDPSREPRPFLWRARYADDDAYDNVIPLWPDIDDDRPLPRRAEGPGA